MSVIEHLQAQHSFKKTPYVENTAGYVYFYTYCKCAM